MASTGSSFKLIDFKPGFHHESTQYAEEGNWYSGDRVRFRVGRPENMRGYAKHNTNPLIGTARDIVSWINNNTEKLMSTGTEQRLYVYYNDYNYDITPITTVVSVLQGTYGNFVTSVGSPLIKVSMTNSGVSVGDWIYFASASVNGFGAAHDFATSAFGGPTFQAVSVLGANAFWISVASVAVSNETAMGNATLSFLLATQQTTNIQGLGYGAGIYNAGASTTNYRAWNTAASTSGITFLANQWSLDNWGEDLLAVRRGGPLYAWDANASVAPARAAIVSTSPAKINSMLVSPNDRHVLAFGTYEYATSAFNPLLVRWSDQEDYTNWTPSISSTSGEIKLIDGTKIVGGIRSRNVIHVWTDRSLYGVQFIGPPYIFSQTQLGANCGLVGPHAAVAVDGLAFWMSKNNFFAFNGGRVEKLACTVNEYVFNDLNYGQADKIYCGYNSEFNEVIWLYPSETALEPDRYVVYNTQENHWVFGTSFYGTFEDKSIFDNTLATGATPVSASSYIWDSEPVSVYTGNGLALTSYLESADFDIETGSNIMFVDKLIPNFDINQGSINFSVNTRMYPDGPVTEKGPYPINDSTQKVDLRARGRQLNVRVSTSDLGTYWRWGSLRLAIKKDGAR